MYFLNAQVLPEREREKSKVA